MDLTPQQEIIAGLTSAQASISPKYFYDHRGSQLFEAITRLPEYYPTRTEMAVMQQYGADIARAVGAGATLIEIGAGNCAKAQALCHWIHPRCFVGVDISADFLRDAMRGLQEDLPQLQTLAVTADLSAPFHLPGHVPQSKRLVFYPGSSIGNFDTEHALDLLKRMRALMDADGGLLIGIQNGAAWTLSQFSPTGVSVGSPFGFGEDQAGNVYVADGGGKVYEFILDEIFTDGFGP